MNTSVGEKVSTATGDDVSYEGFDKWEDNIDNKGLMFTLHWETCECKTPWGETTIDEVLNNLSLVGEYGHIMKQSNRKINKMWTLLDSQSTADLFCNKKMLRNVQQIKI